MAQTLRLSEIEQDLLYKTTVTLNRELVRIGKMPLKESELAHIILEQALNSELEVTRSGEVRICFGDEKEKV